MTREDVLDLRRKPEERDAEIAELVPTALQGAETAARRAFHLLGALAPEPPPAALVQGLGTVRGATRLLLLCQVLLEMGPAGRDAVAALAAQPTRRGRIALDAMHLGLSRGPLRAALADRLRALVRNPALPPRRRRVVASYLMDGGWTSAHEDLRAAAAGDEKWENDPYSYPDGLTAWTPPAPPTDDWLDRFPPQAVQAAMRYLETTVLEAATEVADARASLSAHLDALEQRDREMRRLGRNDPCLCGSGRKVKKCCLDVPTWRTATRVPDLLVRPFRVSPHEHPESAALFGVLLDQPLPQGAGPALLWVDLVRRRGRGEDVDDLARRLVEARGRDPHFHDGVAAATTARLLPPEALEEWLPLFVAGASRDEIALLVVQSRGRELVRLARAVEASRRDEPEIWWGLLYQGVEVRSHDPELLDLLRSAARRLPEPDRSSLQHELGRWCEPEPPAPDLPDRCDDLERPLAALILEGLRRSGDFLLEETLQDWAAELPSPEPPVEDGRDAWAEEVRSRTRMLEEALAPGGALA